ncbi:hypothetical protein [Xanthovirga aplysinae]|uniref:hypothetical protein n=1 Tax=Xanthovirga aplysinae TaxID=2529853 RepID=UPI0012BCCD56|nr:hypothetical protein [Xanthovirga aplysinae]MTI29289.1 hypothetical protein [Xanthovirga aplysinae]
MVDGVLKKYLELVCRYGDRKKAFAELFSDNTKGLQDESNAFVNELEELDHRCWLFLYRKTWKETVSDAQYFTSSAQEKIVVFYDHCFHVFKTFKPYLLTFSQKNLKIERDDLPMKGFLEEISNLFVQFVQKHESITPLTKQQIALLSNVFQIQFIIFLRHWLQDLSKDSIETEEVIQKSIELSRRLICRGSIDKLYELMVFLYHNGSSGKISLL